MISGFSVPIVWLSILGLAFYLGGLTALMWAAIGGAGLIVSLWVAIVLDAHGY